MERVKRFLLLFLSFTLFIMPLCVCVCVVRVHADTTQTYYVVPTEQTYLDYPTTGTLSYWATNSTSEVRQVGFNIESNGDTYIKFVSLDNFTVVINNGGNGSTLSTTSTVVNGTTYYVTNGITATAAGSNGVFKANYRNNFDYLISVSNPSSVTAALAVYYTFGEGSVAPVEPIEYGLVDLEGYQTNVAGSGNAAINNVDVISWNDTFDTLSNDITAGNVRIRYVPGHYKAVDKPNLLQQLYTDFILDVVIDDAEGLYPVKDGSASFRWGQVIEDLSIPFYSIYNLSNSAEGWIKRGWIYQVRLEIDDYIGEWQTVYASTSSGVANDMEIVNTTTITQNTINAIQQVNTINDTTNIWIIYETPVDPSPEYQPPEDDDEKPWWVYLLEMINNSIGVTNEYISEGTDESVQVVNNINNDNDTLNQTVNEYDDIEDDLITDFNDNTENIDLDDTLIGNNGFLNAARWISEQFTTITTDNPFGAILKFSLVLGFVLIFLGRFR